MSIWAWLKIFLTTKKTLLNGMWNDSWRELNHQNSMKRFLGISNLFACDPKDTSSAERLGVCPELTKWDQSLICPHNGDDRRRVSPFLSFGSLFPSLGVVGDQITHVLLKRSSEFWTNIDLSCVTHYWNRYHHALMQLCRLFHQRSFFWYIKLFFYP